ncbi:MAG: AraC family transcriptional regulator [Thermoanaerobaculia bacterium]
MLSEVLRTVRLTGALFFLVDASSPWVAALPLASTFASILVPGAEHLISYHIVTLGPCWARMPDEPPVRLETGDVLVVPHGDPYVLASAPGLRDEMTTEEALSFFRGMAAHELPLVVTEGGGGPGRIGVVCGFLGCDVRPFNPVLATLPRLIHVRRSGGPTPDSLSSLIDLVIAEARARRPGGDCVIQRLGELMFVEVVRQYLAELPAGRTGWLAGLRDPVVGRALALLHARPAEPWTLEDLAKASATSRTALAGRFAALVGQPPMQYLTHWRLQLAARRLADGAAKVAAVAHEVGYESESAFSRAFKRLVGSAPSDWRERRLAGTA